MLRDGDPPLAFCSEIGRFDHILSI